MFRRSKVGFIYQNFNLIPTLTVREKHPVPLSLSGSSPDVSFFTEIVQLLRPAGPTERLPQRAFRRRAAAGGHRAGSDYQALHHPGRRAHRNLDSKTGQNVLGLLKLSVETYRQTLIMITHNLEIAQMADRVVRIEDGAHPRLRGGLCMLANNNLKVCWTLVKRDFRFHRAKNLILALAAMLVTALYTFVFLMGSSVQDAFLLNYQYTYGSTSTSCIPA